MIEGQVARREGKGVRKKKIGTEKGRHDWRARGKKKGTWE